LAYKGFVPVIPAICAIDSSLASSNMGSENCGSRSPSPPFNLGKPSGDIMKLADDNP
jgi:hypothetical protein